MKAADVLALLESLAQEKGSQLGWRISFTEIKYSPNFRPENPPTIEMGCSSPAVKKPYFETVLAGVALPPHNESDFNPDDVQNFIAKMRSFSYWVSISMELEKTLKIQEDNETEELRAQARRGAYGLIWPDTQPHQKIVPLQLDFVDIFERSEALQRIPAKVLGSAFSDILDHLATYWKSIEKYDLTEYEQTALLRQEITHYLELQESLRQQR